MTVQEIASYLQMHRSTIYRLVNNRRIPAFKLGNEWRFNIESIDRWRIQSENLPGLKTGEQ
jgi:excisionase family DNA binding protein